MTTARKPARRTRAPRVSQPQNLLLDSLESRLLLSTATATALVVANPTLTAYVVSADHRLLSGSVTFTDTITPTPTTLGTANLRLVVSGPVDVFAATLTTTLTAGSHALTATYNGDTTHTTSHSSKSLNIGGYTILAFGASAGQHGIIHVFDVKAGIVRAFTPFAGFNGAVNVATGVRDGIPIVAVTPGPGGGPFVKFINALTGAQIGGVKTVFTPAYKGGVSIALGDVNGDGAQDIIVGLENGGSEIKEFSGAAADQFAQLADFHAFANGYTGGIRLSTGDVNGDHVADVAAVTANFAAVVSVFDSDTSTSIFTKNFGPGYTGGGYVFLGNFFGDGHNAVAVTYGNHALPIVQVFRPPNTTPSFAFLAYPASFTNSGGTFGAALDLNGDGVTDYITNLGNTTRLHFINGANATHFTALESAFAGFNASAGFSSISGFAQLLA